ncbi:MAG: tRNA preQ1(34) S-adenosylmethionine ribosyltransferase-isomerase QueA [Vicinamibacterales bacterium]
MHISQFDFPLPPDLIAQEPPAERGASRLLVLDRESGDVQHRAFADLPALLEPTDLVVVNDTRVFHARLLGRRTPGGGAVECLLLRRMGADTWEALVHPGQRLRIGSRMTFETPERRLEGEILARHFHGRRTVRLWAHGGNGVDAVEEIIERIGHVPLPPYIKRSDTAVDRERYQTVYARERGSVAAPTAGLHFTPALLAGLDHRGVERATITLQVGYGTFQPVRVDAIESHTVDPEHFEVPPQAAEALSRARREHRRIIAVGTTTVRTLESLSVAADSSVAASSGQTSLFIRPGHRFRLVDGLITNFHLPRSSLLILVCAFAGRERVLAAYDAAVRERYRFYSYGDAMLIV